MKRLVKRALAGVVIALAALAASEVAYRVVTRFVCTGRGFVGYVPDPRFGWTHEAGKSGVTYGCFGRAYEFRIRVDINSHGLRDRDRDYGKPPSTCRVLVLGDSVAEAYQVEQEQVFPELLERTLSARAKPQSLCSEAARPVAIPAVRRCKIAPSKK